MLVRFHSKASAGVIMFGDIAAELLRMMGASGMVPGALLARDVPEALRRLRLAVASPEGGRILRPARPKAGKHEEDNDEDGKSDIPGIDLRTRSYPLVQLLQAAATEGCDVIWEESDKATG